MKPYRHGDTERGGSEGRKVRGSGPLTLQPSVVT